MYAKRPGFGWIVIGLRQCLLVLEFKTCCQKFPNASYTSPSYLEPISLMFYRKYWWENQNKFSFDRKHIAGKEGGYFSYTGLPPFSLSVSIWQLLVIFLLCKVPLFHLMLKVWAKDMCCGEDSTSHNPGRKSVLNHEDYKKWRFKAV